MNKFEWFLLGCTMVFPAYQYGYGKALDWVNALDDSTNAKGAEHG